MATRCRSFITVTLAVWLITGNYDLLWKVTKGRNLKAFEGLIASLIKLHEVNDERDDVVAEMAYWIDYVKCLYDGDELFSNALQGLFCNHRRLRDSVFQLVRQKKTETLRECLEHLTNAEEFYHLIEQSEHISGEDCNIDMSPISNYQCNWNSEQDGIPAIFASTPCRAIHNKCASTTTYDSGFKSSLSLPTLDDEKTSSLSACAQPWYPSSVSASEHMSTKYDNCISATTNSIPLESSLSLESPSDGKDETCLEKSTLSASAPPWYPPWVSNISDCGPAESNDGSDVADRTENHQRDELHDASSDSVSVAPSHRVTHVVSPVCSSIITAVTASGPKVNAGSIDSNPQKTWFIGEEALPCMEVKSAAEGTSSVTEGTSSVTEQKTSTTENTVTSSSVCSIRTQLSDEMPRAAEEATHLKTTSSEMEASPAAAVDMRQAAHDEGNTTSQVEQGGKDVPETPWTVDEVPQDIGESLPVASETTPDATGSETTPAAGDKASAQDDTSPEAQFTRTESHSELLKHIPHPQKHARNQHNKQYDFFVSYNGKDADWVFHSLLPKCEKQHGFKGCIADRDFKLGKTILDNIEHSLEHSVCTIFVLTPNFVQSSFCQHELDRVLHRMMMNKHTFLPVVLKECKVPLKLQSHTYMDATDSINWNRLVENLNARCSGDA